MKPIITSILIILASASFAVEYPLSIPTDSKAKYFVLEKGGTENNPTLITKRIGPSGTSYSKQLFDCKAHTAKYLGDGSTLEKMEKSKPSPNMGPLIEGSITWYKWKNICNN